MIMMINNTINARRRWPIVFLYCIEAALMKGTSIEIGLIAFSLGWKGKDVV